MNELKLLAQLNQNHEKTVEILNRLISRDEKDLNPAIDALIVQSKKNNNQMVNAIEALIKKDSSADFSKIEKAISKQTQSLQNSLEELKKKYSERLKELQGQLPDKDLKKKIADLNRNFSEKVAKFEKLSSEVENFVIAQATFKNKTKKDIGANAKEIKVLQKNSATKAELKDLDKNLNKKIDAVSEIDVSEIVEKEVDSRYRRVTTAPKQELSIEGNNLTISEGNTVPLPGGGGVEQYDDLASFPATGEVDIIYVAKDTQFAYYWDGSSYQVTGDGSIALGETSTTAYRGDRGKTAYDHSQLTSGNPHNVSASDVGLGNVDNTSDLDKPVSTATQAAIDAVNATNNYSSILAPQLFNPDATGVSSDTDDFTLSSSNDVAFVSLNGKVLDDSEYSLVSTTLTVTPDNGFSGTDDEVLVFQHSYATVTGGFIANYTAKTTTYTVTSDDYTVDCTTGTFTVTLPTAVGITGKVFVIKNSGSGVITVDGDGSETIDGATTQSLNQYDSITVQSNGSNWIII